MEKKTSGEDQFLNAPGSVGSQCSGAMTLLKEREAFITLRNSLAELENYTRFECSFHIFSTRFECISHIFPTRFECNSKFFSLGSSLLVLFREVNGQSNNSLTVKTLVTVMDQLMLLIRGRDKYVFIYAKQVEYDCKFLKVVVVQYDCKFP